MIRSTKTLKAGGFDAAHAVDTVELDFEDRRRRRATFKGVNGSEFHVDLADAPTLSDGDGFELETGAIVLVKGKPERLVEFRSKDASVITRVAWHLGNRHTPTQLLPHALRIRDDYVLVELVKKLGAEVVFVEAAFQPEGGAYGHGTVSGHDHADHDHADHDHGHHDHAHHDDHMHDKHDHDHGHTHSHAAPAQSEEDRLMAETIARREARRAARTEQVHVHGPNCGHDHDHSHHDHDHAHQAHGHDHHDHDHAHDHKHDHAHDHHH